jgi:DNA polymerase delta subunit 1
MRALSLSTFSSPTVSGDHTRTVSIVAPTVGGLMKFAVRTVTCLGCKTPLKPGTPSTSPSLISSSGTKSNPALLQTTPSAQIADHARPNSTRSRSVVLAGSCPSSLVANPAFSFYQLQITAVNETAFARLWTQCQRCQGSLHQVRFSSPSAAVRASLPSLARSLTPRP